MSRETNAHSEEQKLFVAEVSVIAFMWISFFLLSADQVFATSDAPPFLQLRSEFQSNPTLWWHGMLVAYLAVVPMVILFTKMALQQKKNGLVGKQTAGKSSQESH